MLSMYSLSSSSYANGASCTTPITSSMTDDDAQLPACPPPPHRSAATTDTVQADFNVGLDEEDDVGRDERPFFPHLASLPLPGAAAAAAATMVTPKKPHQRKRALSEHQSSSTLLSYFDSSSDVFSISNSVNANVVGRHSPPIQPRRSAAASSALRSLSPLTLSPLTVTTRPPLMLNNLKEWPYGPLKRIAAANDDADSMDYCPNVHKEVVTKRRRRASLLDELSPHHRSSLLDDHRNRSSFPRAA